MARLALSFLLRDAGYDTIILKVPPAGPAEELLRDVDLLLVSPDLDDRRRTGSLTALGGTGTVPRIPVLTLGPVVKDGLFATEAAGPSWPVEIGGLVQAIEATLRDGAESGPAIVASPAEDAALP